MSLVMNIKCMSRYGHGTTMSAPREVPCHFVHALMLPPMDTNGVISGWQGGGLENAQARRYVAVISSREALVRIAELLCCKYFSSCRITRVWSKRVA